VFFDRPGTGERAVLVHLELDENEDREDPRELEELARRRGVDRDQLAEVLAKYIPRIIDELTPGGQLPRR
jgi:uncharacterized protein YidB (DUF937 family)